MTQVVIHREYAPLVQTSKSYRAEVVVAVELPADVLAKWLRENRKEMRTGAIVAFKDLLVQAQNWRLK